MNKENVPTGAFRCSWVITSFDSGYHAIPPAIIYIDTVKFESNPVLLEVHTVEVDTTKEFKDIKDIIGAASDHEDENKSGISVWWYMGGGLILLGLLLFFLLRKKKPAAKESQAAVLPLHVQCLLKLQETEKQQYWQRGEVKQYYTEVTDVIREYITRRFNIKSFELTSHQLLHQLRVNGIAESIHLPLKELFSLADMAKFARVKPIASENEAAIEIARRFIHQTTPVEPQETGSK